MSAGSVLTANIYDGQPVYAAALSGNFTGAAYDISQTVNPFGGDSRYGGQRAAFWTGIGLFIGGKILAKVAPGLHRAGFKIGRHNRIALT